jgi:hypothetical protein
MWRLRSLRRANPWALVQPAILHLNKRSCVLACFLGKSEQSFDIKNLNSKLLTWGRNGVRRLWSRKDKWVVGPVDGVFWLEQISRTHEWNFLVEVCLESDWSSWMERFGLRSDAVSRLQTITLRVVSYFERLECHLATLCLCEWSLLVHFLPKSQVEQKDAPGRVRVRWRLWSFLVLVLSATVQDFVATGLELAGRALEVVIVARFDWLVP